MKFSQRQQFSSLFFRRIFLDHITLPWAVCAMMACTVTAHAMIIEFNTLPFTVIYVIYVCYVPVPVCSFMLLNLINYL